MYLPLFWVGAVCGAPQLLARSKMSNLLRVCQRVLYTGLLSDLGVDQARDLQEVGSMGQVLL